MVEVILALVEGARIDGLSLSQKDQPVKEGHNIRPRLVDREYDSSLVRLRQGDQAFDDVISVEGVQTAGRFVQEQNGRAGDELACNSNASLLSARYPAALALFGSNQ